MRRKLFWQSPNPSFRRRINQKRKILQPVGKPNQLSSVPEKPSALKTVRKPNQPKHKTVLAKNQLPKDPEILQNVNIQRTKPASYERPKLRPFKILAFAFAM